MLHRLCRPIREAAERISVGDRTRVRNWSQYCDKYLLQYYIQIPKKCPLNAFIDSHIYWIFIFPMFSKELLSSESVDSLSGATDGPSNHQQQDTRRHSFRKKMQIKTTFFRDVSSALHEIEELVLNSLPDLNRKWGLHCQKFYSYHLLTTIITLACLLP